MTTERLQFHIKAHKSWTLSWNDWQDRSGLETLDAAFIDWLSCQDIALVDALNTYRSTPVDRTAQSRYLMLLAPLVEQFIVEGFKLGTAYQALLTRCAQSTDKAKARMALTRALKLPAEAPSDRDAELWKTICASDDPIQSALAIWMDGTEAARASLLRALRPEVHKPEWAYFQGPKRIIWDALVPLHKEGPVQSYPDPQPRNPSFAWSDQPYGMDAAQHEAQYCVYCHKTQGDYCSIGFLNKKHEPELGVRQNPLGTSLDGCPLNQHISEMNLLRAQGNILAALLVIMVENPLCCLTGQRICNDCSSACIYQKQSPVDIPNVETQTLRDILSLDWGIEWYLLFLAWNPLHPQPLPKAKHHRQMAVFGLGPAGIASAYYLWREGMAVACFDGLALSSPPSTWIREPIRHLKDWWEPLEQRTQKGFGGVAEYGITARWDKNFLSLPWLAFARFGIRCEGGVRLGGTLLLEDLWPMGFEHAVLALGAGLPQALSVPNSFGSGIRAANDFLMTLHMQGGNALNPQTLIDVRLPAVVIGGGLTAVDAATELQAYYIHLVTHVKALVDQLGGIDALIAHGWTHDTETLTQWYEHGARLASGADPMSLIAALGGVSILYRRSLQEAPCYRANAHELECAMKEGIRFIEHHESKAFVLDASQHVSGIRTQHSKHHTELYLPARTVLIAIGSQPNVAYEYEHAGTFKKEGAYYASASGSALDPTRSYKHQPIDMMTSYHHGRHRAFYVGDLHPSFHGSVVRALASAKRAIPQVLKALELPPLSAPPMPELRPKVVSVTRCAQELYHLKLWAPRHTAHIQAGHLFRLQSQTIPLEEATPVRVFDWDTHHLELFLRADTPAAQSLCQLEAGSPIAIMGPTGVRMRMDDRSEHTWVISDAHGLPEAICLVHHLDRQGIQVSWAYEASEEEHRWIQSRWGHIPHIQFTETSLHRLSEADFEWQTVRRVLIQGKASLLKSIGRLKSQQAFPAALQATRWMGSVLGPMQCMLKGVCASCWQWQVDPKTGKRSKAVFACSWQDQPLELIDIEHLALRQENHSSLHTLLMLSRHHS